VLRLGRPIRLGENGHDLVTVGMSPMTANVVTRGRCSRNGEAATATEGSSAAEASAVTSNERRGGLIPTTLPRHGERHVAQR
jgi:hypothetical protein